MDRVWHELRDRHPIGELYLRPAGDRLHAERCDECAAWMPDAANSAGGICTAKDDGCAPWWPACWLFARR